ncbi:MAG: hypothetical protein SGILL_004037 [Bacillariaceae sp.]
MASEEGPKPSPTETTDTTSVVSDDDEERLLKEDEEGETSEQQQHLDATSSSDTSADHSKSASQTRFSFYDAQEVQSKFVSTMPQKEQQRKAEEEKKQLYRYNFYDPASLPGDASNPIKINISGSGDATVPANQGPASSSQRYEPPQRPQPLFPREGLSPVDRMRHVSSQNSLHNNNSNNASQHSHTDDILRSLQETEEQRMQILQPAGVLLSAPPHVAAAPTTDVNTMSASSVISTGSASLVATSSLNASNHHAQSTATSSNNDNNNPYEDAIREALDLLRKHRSPPPSPSMNAIMGSSAAATASLGGVASLPPQPTTRRTPTAAIQEDENTTEDSQRIATTPAANSATDISSSDSLTDALQEAKLKAKQRQERMAEYASRLQEFKSSLPPEEQQVETENQQPESSQLTYDQQQRPPLPSPSSSQIQPMSSIVNDVDSVGLISDISQSNSAHPASAWQAASYSTQPLQQPQRAVDEEVQKGVEKVLMAILEASKSNTSSNNSHLHDNSGGSVVETASTHSGVSEVLLKAMDEVLYGKHNNQSALNASDTQGGAVPTSMSGISKFSAKSHNTNQSKRSGGERSVVDELLAEADEQPLSRYWPREEKKMTENDPVVASSALGTMKTKTVFSDTTNNIKVSKEETEKDIDALIEESLQESNKDDADDQEEMVSEEFEVDEDDDLNSEYDEEGSYADEENDGSDQNDGDGEDANESHPTRVLGPLSRNAGGTTGVVLDAASNSNPASPDVAKESKGYFSSVVKYVTSALTPDRQRLIDNQKNEVQAQESDDSEDRSTDDVEATDLMRTLCAHLLPYGVDRQANLEEVVPGWDEENPNEAGYRIIRLSKSQLRRVERAFDKMINGLKSKSQSKLSLGEGEYDANFIRELQEAERLLDDEENRTRSGDLTQEVVPKSTPSPPNDGTAVVEPETESCVVENDKLTTPAHPDFPGIKTAGKGEMGDLEFFHLPIVFKSHVTGFEPTKDMVLEPGNVVAGQYLVESELGSAAFSTAYRCIDLSSEDKDGHEEVCLKVIKNTKDFFDQSLDEIKILELLRQTGQCDDNFIIRMKTFFYYREHLIIVTELLRQNLFEFGKFIIDNDEEPYFTIPRLAYVTRQCLVALRFVHKLGLVHSDIKPENILLGSYSRAKTKVIDFGSSCYLTDRQSSYIQSRSYRAPEVVLGLPYDGKIDVWSLGCVVAEMYTGEVTFQNDSIVSMLSRIEAICGSFPRHMIAQGRQSGRFFTKSGLLYEVVDDSDNDSTKNTPPGPNDDESDSETDTPIHYDIFQPKNTRLSSRLGFEGSLMDDYENNSYSGSGSLSEHELEQIFTDFVARLLTIDPDGRPSADEALQHPWMLYAAALTEEDIKYP